MASNPITNARRDTLRAEAAALTAEAAELDALLNPAGPPPPPNTPPSTAGVPVITGVAKVGQILTATPPTFTGTAPIALAYQWLRGIPGATNPSYTPITGDIGTALTVQVRATNAAGTVVVTSAPTSVVVAADPIDPPPPASGEFTVANGRIMRNGVSFVGRGVNVLGEHMFWPNGSTLGLLPALKAWRFNLVRVNNAEVGGAPNAEWGRNDWNDVSLPEIVTAYNAAGIVTMLGLNATESGQWPGEGSEAVGVLSLAHVISWWKTKARPYYTNPNVWINPLNESGDDWDHAKWFDVYNQIIQALRADGCRNLIVPCGNHWGQDIGAWGTGNVAVSQSSILSKGTALLAADPLHRLAFDLHIYDQWSQGTDAQAAAKLANFIDQASAGGLPILFGEIGATWDNADQRQVGVRAGFTVGAAKSLSMTWWHAQPGDGFSLTKPGALDATNDLTPLGQLYWNMRLPA